MIHPCDLCGEMHSLDLPGDPSGKIRICAKCGFVHVKERRSVQEIALAWDDIYSSGHYDPTWPGVRGRLFYVAEYLHQNIGLDGKSVLDIGAGNGDFLDFCRQKGAYPVGLDPSWSNCSKIKVRDIACFNGFADENSPVIGTYDLITLNWTLENTGNALSVLKWAKKCLAKDGNLSIATGSRLLVPFKKPLSSYLPQKLDYPHDTHCFRWSVNSLTRACEAIGLTNHSQNDWQQRDELIMTFVRGEGENESDDPQAVREYFERWQREWP